MEQAHWLRDVPFLAGLSDEELQTLASSLRRRRFANNEVIFHREDPGDALFIIASGKVKVALRSEDGREVILTMLSPGEYVGELAILDGEPRSADAIAVGATEVLVLPRARFLQFLEANANAAVRMLAAVTRQYVRRLTDAVEDVTFLDVPARLAKVLVQMLEIEHPGGGSGRLQVTQNDLSAMVGATRESVNKWLGYFERRGWVERDRGSVLILDAKLLSALVR